MNCVRFVYFANNRHDSAGQVIKIVLTNRGISEVFRVLKIEGVGTIQEFVLHVLKQIEIHHNGTSALKVHIHYFLR